MIENLKKFCGLPEEVKLSNGDIIKVYPLTTKEFMELRIKNEELRNKRGGELSEQDKIEIENELIKMSLKDEKITNEVLENMPLIIRMKIVDAIDKVNGLKEEDEKRSKLKEEFAKRIATKP